MSKTVLVISGSPRKGGNSEILCDQFIQGAEAGGHAAEKVRLRDLTVNFCLACDGCKKNDGRCVQKDDVPALLDKMIAADVIVLATPVYFYAMAGQVKTLIDRTYSRYKELADKAFYVIMTAADNDAHATRTVLEEFRGFIHYVTGADEKGAISGLGVWGRGEIKGKAAMDQARALGKSV